MTVRAWVVRVVPMADVEWALIELERTHPPSGPPILTFVDQSRIIIAWPYLEPLDAT